jgi:hypothetical protein
MKVVWSSMIKFSPYRSLEQKAAHEKNENERKLENGRSQRLGVGGKKVAGVLNSAKPASNTQVGS